LTLNATFSFTKPQTRRDWRSFIPGFNITLIKEEKYK